MKLENVEIRLRQSIKINTGEWLTPDKSIGAFGISTLDAIIEDTNRRLALDGNPVVFSGSVMKDITQRKDSSQPANIYERMIRLNGTRVPKITIHELAMKIHGVIQQADITGKA